MGRLVHHCQTASCPIWVATVTVRYSDIFANGATTVAPQLYPGRELGPHWKPHPRLGRWAEREDPLPRRPAAYNPIENAGNYETDSSRSADLAGQRQRGADRERHRPSHQRDNNSQVILAPTTRPRMRATLRYAVNNTFVMRHSNRLFHALNPVAGSRDHPPEQPVAARSTDGAGRRSTTSGIIWHQLDSVRDGARHARRDRSGFRRRWRLPPAAGSGQSTQGFRPRPWTQRSESERRSEAGVRRTGGSARASDGLLDTAPTNATRAGAPDAGVDGGTPPDAGTDSGQAGPGTRVATGRPGNPVGSLTAVTEAAPSTPPPFRGPSCSGRPSRGPHRAAPALSGR